MVHPPISLAPDLAKILEGDPDFKVKHGVIGLLKNLAQSASNRVPLGQAGIIARLADCGILEDKSDRMEIIQVSAIGVVKHLCNGNGSYPGSEDDEHTADYNPSISPELSFCGFEGVPT